MRLDFELCAQAQTLSNLPEHELVVWLRENIKRRDDAKITSQLPIQAYTPHPLINKVVTIFVTRGDNETILRHKAIIQQIVSDLS